MTTRQTIKRFFEPVKYAPKSYAFGLFADIRDAFQSIFSIQIGTWIIQAIEDKDSYMLVNYAILLGSIFLISYCISFARELLQEYYDNMMGIKMKKDYFLKLLHIEQTTIEKVGLAKLQDIILSGVNAWGVMITTAFSSILVEIGAIIYALVLVAYKSPTIYHFLGFVALFVLASIGIFKGLLILGKTREKSKELTIEIKRKEIKYIMSTFEILQNNKHEYEFKSQENIVQQRISLWQKGNAKKLLRQLSTNIILDGLQIFIYITIGLAIISGSYSLAYLSLLLRLLNSVSKYVRSIRSSIKRWLSSKIDVDKLRDFFDKAPMRDKNAGADFSYKSGNISLRNISFSYESGKEIFSDFSLDIRGGTKTALVGESGGGKTTLIKLIAGYMKPDSGEVLVDGQKLSETKLSDYYRHIGYLTQEPSVFDGTVYENLVYGLDDAPQPPVPEGSIPQTTTQEKDSLPQGGLGGHIASIITLSRCEFIYDLPQGLHTEIGERGVRLSGGQKQRLAIAKIMLKNPNIILLDEPTSALDSFNEELVSQALTNLFQGKTVIVVAHRLQTVKNADRILYIGTPTLERGARGDHPITSIILEEGTHESLIALGGKYNKMLDLQSGF